MLSWNFSSIIIEFLTPLIAMKGLIDHFHFYKYRRVKKVSWGRRVKEIVKLLNKIFNENYYRIKKFERDGKIYEILGVRRFKRLLLRMARSRKNEVPFNGYFLKERSIEGIIEFKIKSKKSERSHVIIAIIILLYQIRIIIFLDGILDVIFLLFFTVLNVITNIYPIFLQRYNRIKINKVLQKMNSQKR